MSRSVTVEVDGNTVDGDVVDDIRISYGRRRTDEQPQAAQLVLTIITDMASWDYTVGQTVTVTGSIGVNDYVRFDGRIVQVSVGRYTTEVIATSSGLGALANAPREAFDVQFGQPTGVLIQYLKANGPFVIDPNFSNGLVYPEPGYQIGPGTALDLMQTVAGWDIGGLLLEEPDGTLHYETTNERASVSPADATILAAHVLDDWTAEQSIDSLTNEVTVTWSTGSLRVADDVSVATYGVFGISADAPLQSSAQAYTYASKLLAGTTVPTWRTFPIVVFLKTMSDADAEDLLACRVSSILDLTAVAAELPGVPSDAFLEGYEERIRNRADDWQISLFVSDVSMTRKPQSWDEVTANLEWDQVSATLTWLQAIGTQL